ncbi:hypothetical protein COY25_01925 [Candidatus Uhrbacteria bacterium CG_4_10_14_0_2_um_filter_41_7]|uniref:Glycerophosphoryl diester phosphodiesterase membrane domain-containing protein n=1 Tax=Candidatus Uhrbacteria bacterium CG_4_9_14_3_um_filter_41_35 TaxID=1975034 RepID=A0A2M7XFW7_9BACT|nr:MAG: hypothetical protein COV92_02945 [Candidatus Uhrbacteria bacterium CG11_big_fil_rev_8_21_14_0_20_41_9]PIZ54584.1 MAG: hypothetical protein COY25_01925 [Candidatus Uhrbacteria bacterium CG_4_10_14_0_2_um_filter_41_7]PJA46745.1 MAG: hypothetical protein CO173_01480 [Candidatus Uhrbacteria bacterium CG_4_9_14_3_um_filter_41_35]
MTPSEKQNKQEKLKGVFELLLETLKIYYKNFGLYLGYSAWLFIPLVLTVFSVVTFSKETVQLLDLVFNLFIYSLMLVWIIVTFTIITPLIKEGRAIKTREISSEAWASIIPYSLISLLVLVIEFSGFLLLIIPGIVFVTWYYFAGIITVTEKIHVTLALKQSRALSKDRFFSVFWRIAGGNLFLFCLSGLVLSFIIYLNISTTKIDLLTYITAPPSILDSAIYRVSEAFLLPIIAIYQVLLYLELKKTASPAKVAIS